MLVHFQISRRLDIGRWYQTKPKCRTQTSKKYNYLKDYTGQFEGRQKEMKISAEGFSKMVVGFSGTAITPTNRSKFSQEKVSSSSCNPMKSCPQRLQTYKMFLWIFRWNLWGSFQIMFSSKSKPPLTADKFDFLVKWSPFHLDQEFWSLQQLSETALRQRTP